MKAAVKKITAGELKGEMLLGGAKTFDKVFYLYLSPDKTFLLHSTSPKALLDHPEVKKPLKLSVEGISFFLQSGVIPTPRSIYQEVFVLGIGDRLLLSSEQGKLKVNFFHEFPYPNTKRIKGNRVDVKRLLHLLSKSITEKMIPHRPIFLFQSIGKDSNSILVALAETDLKDKTTALTLALPGSPKDESEMACEVAKKLGVRHEKLYLPKNLSSAEVDFLRNYFSSIPFPCADGASLAYPLYQLQMDFSDSNLVDGSGNDYYFGHVPRKVEYQRQKVYPKFKFLRSLAERLPTGNVFYKLARTRSEMIGLVGLSLADFLRIFPQAQAVYPFWIKEDERRKDWDYYDLKADLWATHVELANVIGKVKNFTEVMDVNLVLPWADEEIADYVGSLDEREVFDRKNFKNKLPLRRFLWERLGLDCDRIGKYSYGFPTYVILQMMKEKVKEEVFHCYLWERKALERFWPILVEKAKENKIWQKVYERLYLLSAFLNHTRYLAGEKKG